MTVKDEIQLIQEQLAGLAMAVKSDENFATNKEDYLVTVNSLKNRLEKAKLTGDPPMAGIKTGRIPSRGPNVQTSPRTSLDDAAIKASAPVTNRRAAIEHTRKLNESRDNS